MSSVCRARDNFVKWYHTHTDDIYPDETISEHVRSIGQKPEFSADAFTIAQEYDIFVTNVQIARSLWFAKYLVARVLTYLPPSDYTTTYTPTAHQKISAAFRTAIQLYQSCRTYYPNTPNPVGWLLAQTEMRTIWKHTLDSGIDTASIHPGYFAYTQYMFCTFSPAVGQWIRGLGISVPTNAAKTYSNSGTLYTDTAAQNIDMTNILSR